MAMHAVFLETDMRAAWEALQNEGTRHEEGPRHLVQAMKADCHGREDRAWSAECDRALYLESVLEVSDAATAVLLTNSHQPSSGIVPAREHQRLLHSGLKDVPVMPAASLPFSTFFLEYAVPRCPVAISKDGSVEGVALPVDDVDDNGNKDYSASDAISSASTVAVLPEQRFAVDEGLLDMITVCLPLLDEASTSGVAEGSLSGCPDAVLENLPISRYSAGDFVQRFRGDDVLPTEEHAGVESFTSKYEKGLGVGKFLRSVMLWSSAATIHPARSAFLDDRMTTFCFVNGHKHHDQ